MARHIVGLIEELVGSLLEIFFSLRRLITLSSCNHFPGRSPDKTGQSPPLHKCKVEIPPFLLDTPKKTPNGDPKKILIMKRDGLVWSPACPKTVGPGFPSFAGL